MPHFLGDNVAFIFPDLETALVGRFENGRMLSGRPTRIVAERCKHGMKELKFAKPNWILPIFKYQRPTWIQPGDQPTVADPFELRTIYIADGLP